MGLDIKSLLVGALGGKLAGGQDIHITLPENKTLPTDDSEVAPEE